MTSTTAHNSYDQRPLDIEVLSVEEQSWITGEI